MSQKAREKKVTGPVPINLVHDLSEEEMAGSPKKKKKLLNDKDSSESVYNSPKRSFMNSREGSSSISRKEH